MYDQQEITKQLLTVNFYTVNDTKKKSQSMIKYKLTEYDLASLR